MDMIHICNVKHESESKVQFIPFTIHVGCGAEFKEGFDKNIRPINESLHSIYVHGRLLLGRQVSLPEGYTGVFLHEAIAPTKGQKERTLRVKHRFNAFRTWNWDHKTSRNPAFLKSLAKRIEIAEALHAPISE